MAEKTDGGEFDRTPATQDELQGMVDHSYKALKALATSEAPNFQWVVACALMTILHILVQVWAELKARPK